MNLDTVSVWEAVNHSSEYETACFQRYAEHPTGGYATVANIPVGDYNWEELIDHQRSLAKTTGKKDLKNAIAEKYQTLGFNEQNSSLDCVSDKNFPNIFEEFAASVGLKDWWYRIQIQQPGQVFPAHVDSLRSWAIEFEQAAKTHTHRQVKRFQIFLYDQEVGHFMSVGNTPLTWRKGDVVQFDHRIPHATANSGFTPKALAVLEGV